MAQAGAKIRLHVAADLGPVREVALAREQAHYLFGVMRRGPGDEVRLFNGRDGEWLAEIVAADRRGGLLRCLEQTISQSEPPDLWLLFAPIKKARTDFIAEKACEMGCRRLFPVFTAHTNAERVNTERLRAHAVEAAEQCGLVSVPEVAEPVALAALLDAWPADRQILFCDETGPRPPAAEVLRRADPGPWAVLTGPEGGFSPDEALRLHKNRLAHAVSLGPRILRADTAAVAALTLWQATLGDWR
jgi:16S rRNA (uracil1498-N3)-methyltransferase